MNIKKIKECSQELWKLISRTNKKWNINELKDATGFTNNYLVAGIGWLACQNKIQVEEKTGRYYNVLNYYIG